MEVILLMGLPGSGKSTLASKFDGYSIINQDTLGTRQACIKLASALLDDQKNVVIDRCNINKVQRKYWVDLALSYGASSIKCIYLDVDPVECVYRITERKNHPTISQDMPIDKKQQIVVNFFKDMEMPSLEEGFSEIILKRN